MAEEQEVLRGPFGGPPGGVPTPGSILDMLRFPDGLITALASMTAQERQEVQRERPWAEVRGKEGGCRLDVVCYVLVGPYRWQFAW